MTPTTVPDAAELARLVRVLDAVPALVHTRRTSLGLSARACAGQVRVSGPGGTSRPIAFVTVLRCEAGKALSVPILRAFLVWLGTVDEGAGA